MAEVIDKAKKIKKIKKIKIKDKGRAVDENGADLEGFYLEAPALLPIEFDNPPILACFKFPLTNTYSRVEILDDRVKTVVLDLGPKETKFLYRLVYEPTHEAQENVKKMGKSPFDGLTCKKVFDFQGKFKGHEFGKNTPTGGGEGGGTVS